MKIIDSGRTYSGKCPACGCIVAEVFYKETKKKEVVAFDPLTGTWSGPRKHIRYIDCPNCREVIEVTLPEAAPPLEVSDP